MSVKTLSVTTKYDISDNRYSDKKIGHYGSVGTEGIAYNLALFLKQLSGRSKTGKIKFSKVKFPKSIKLIRDNGLGKPIVNNYFDNYYIPSNFKPKEYRGISIPSKYLTSKTIYVRVYPTKKKKVN